MRKRGSRGNRTPSGNGFESNLNTKKTFWPRQNWSREVKPEKNKRKKKPKGESGNGKGSSKVKISKNGIATGSQNKSARQREGPVVHRVKRIAALEKNGQGEQNKWLKKKSKELKR